jgi:hypothetical protein
VLIASAEGEHPDRLGGSERVTLIAVLLLNKYTHKV